MIWKIMLLLLVFMVSAHFAVADCEYNGALYPEGTVIGPYTCRGSQWKIE
ncbi:MAG: hypothetical protein PHI06_09210 [Desulfobulbaceae bacterium]|nr:hypothetical protein [Desulfobulbaceae bacterium]